MRERGERLGFLLFAAGVTGLAKFVGERKAIVRTIIVPDRFLQDFEIIKPSWESGTVGPFHVSAGIIVVPQMVVISFVVEDNQDVVKSDLQGGEFVPSG